MWGPLSVIVALHVTPKSIRQRPEFVCNGWQKMAVEVDKAEEPACSHGIFFWGGGGFFSDAVWDLL